MEKTLRGSSMPEHTPSELTILTTHDAQYAEQLRQELAAIALSTAAQLQKTTQTVTTEQQFHILMQQQLEAYSLHLEQWVNNSAGRSPKQQRYIEEIANHMRDAYTEAVLKRMELAQ